MKLELLRQHYNSDKDPRPIVDFVISDDGTQIGCLVGMNLRQEPVSRAIPGVAADLTPEDVAPLVEAAVQNFLRGVVQWINQMGKTCPLCGGELTEAAIMTTQGKSPVTCASCGWSPPTPTLTPGGDHAPN